MSEFRLKMIFGFSILLVLAVLASVVALGKVEQQTSHGLDIVLSALGVLAGGFAQWAFTHHEEQK
jgi:hypothetical protein